MKEKQFLQNKFLYMVKDTFITNNSLSLDSYPLFQFLFFGVEQSFYLSLAENLSAMFGSGRTGLGGKKGEVQKIPCA